MKRYSLATIATVLSLATQSPAVSSSAGFRNIPEPQPFDRGITLGPRSEDLVHEKGPAKRKSKFPFQKCLKKDVRHR